jgi:hypothetical protein
MTSTVANEPEPETSIRYTLDRLASVWDTPTAVPDPPELIPPAVGTASNPWPNSTPPARLRIAAEATMA